MANITELQLQGDSTVHKLNDARITTTAVTTATHILTTNSGVTSIAPITAANLASVLGDSDAYSIPTQAEAHTIFKIGFSFIRTYYNGAKLGSIQFICAYGNGAPNMYEITASERDGIRKYSISKVTDGNDGAVFYTDDDGALYITPTYGGPRILRGIGIIINSATNMGTSTEGLTQKNVIDTTYLDSYSSLANLASALGVGTFYNVNNIRTVTFRKICHIPASGKTNACFIWGQAKAQYKNKDNNFSQLVTVTSNPYEQSSPSPLFVEGVNIGETRFYYKQVTDGIDVFVDALIHSDAIWLRIINNNGIDFSNCFAGTTETTLTTTRC